MSTSETTSSKAPDVTNLLFSPGNSDDPTESYRTLRDECPVAHAQMGPNKTYFISRYEDVLSALRNPQVFSSDSDAVSIGQEQPLIPLQVDPPLHTHYRRVLNPAFTPTKIAELEDDVRAIVNGLIDKFSDRDSCDFHEEFATPLPSTIFIRLMGWPQDDLPKFLQWRDNTIRPAVDPTDFEGAARIREATGKEINAYFEEAIDRAQREPGDGLMSYIVHAQIGGRPLNREELLGMCHLLMLGGLDTVTATLDCMVTYLARHPSHRDRLAGDPSLWPSAIEELLRRETPVTVVPRMVKEELSLHGVDLHKGDLVTLVLGAANTDQDRFSDAEEVELTRDPNKHLAFGGGHHLCLGAHLARLELQIGLEEFHRRIPAYRIREDAEVHFSPGIRQADHLPLVFERARA